MPVTGDSMVSKTNRYPKQSSHTVVVQFAKSRTIKATKVHQGNT
jgi:hypothetical protein